jgi:hypothetical protein
MCNNKGQHLGNPLKLSSDAGHACNKGAVGCNKACCGVEEGRVAGFGAWIGCEADVRALT